MLEKKIWDILATIVNPTTQKDLVTSNMISGLKIDNGSVIFAIEIDPKYGTEMEALRQETVKKIEVISGIKSVTAILTAEKSIPPAGIKITKPKSRLPAPDVKHVIAVSSAKGGVGKSTIAVNLAYSLKNKGLNVGLLDADIYGPSQPKMLNVMQRPEMTEDKYIIPIQVKGLPTMSIGYMMENPDDAIVWRGPMIQKALNQMLCDVAWGALDILIIDLPPGTGDVQLTLAQKAHLTGAIIVSTPQDIALIDSIKGISMFKKLNVNVLGMIENMSTFICPNCDNETSIFGHGGAKKQAHTENINFLGDIPLDIKVRQQADKGLAIVLSDPDHAISQSFSDIADNIMAELEAKKSLYTRKLC